MLKRGRVRSWVAVLLTFFFVVGLFPNTLPEAWASGGIEITGISPTTGSASGCIITISGSGFSELDASKLEVRVETDKFTSSAVVRDFWSDTNIIRAELKSVTEKMIEFGLDQISADIVVTDGSRGASCKFTFIADPILSGMSLNTDIYLTRNAEGELTGERTAETQAVLTGIRLDHPLDSWRIGNRPVNVLTDIRRQDISLLVGKLPDGLHMGQKVNVYLETVYGGKSELAGADAVMLNSPPDITSLNKYQFVVGEELIIQGTGFVAGSVIDIAGGRIDPVTADMITNNGQKITITVPAPVNNTSGKKDVRVILPNGSSATLKEELEILSTPGEIGIRTVTPNHGSANGGTLVQIAGYGFQNEMQVLFGDNYATGVTLIEPPEGAPEDTTILQVITPAGPDLGGPVNVRVQDPLNSRVFTVLSEGFTYTKIGDDLYVGQVAPISGYETGGEVVSVQGRNFLRFREGGIERTINGNPLSPDLHELQQDLALASTKVVTQEKVMIADPLNPGQTIQASVSRTLRCTFGGNYAVLTRVAPREDGTWLLTSKTPQVTLQSRAPEAVDVIITTLEEVKYADPTDDRNGQTIAALTRQEQEKSYMKFTYRPVPSAPEIDKVETLIGDNSIAPAKGSTAGGTTVKITGLDFQDNAKVYFGAKEPARQGQLQKVEYGALNEAKNKIVATLTVTTPSSNTRGPVDVIVVNPDEGECMSKADAEDPNWLTHFTYISNPSVTKITPNIGPREGGVYITLEGDGFYYIPEEAIGTEGVYIGGQRASDIRVYTADGERLTTESPASRVGQKIKACVPASTAGNYPATVDVTVKNVDEGQVTVTEGFTYLDPTEAQKPRVTSLTPIEGSIEGGTPFVIKGSNFGNEVMVTFDGEPAVQVEVGRGGTEITGKTPPGMEVEKKVPVQVIRLDTGGLYDLPAAFTYHRITTQPKITDFAPTHGGVGTVVTINGTDFVRGGPGD